jgi:two-component system alkaline phosphatase synthesis response regulator PhoP
MIKTINSGKKILIIDDEKHIAEAIKLNLSMQGHETFVAPNGTIGIDLYKKAKPDLIVVDLMMPEIDGVGVIQFVRSDNKKIPILVISAKDQVQEKVHCLSLGVDDYLSKPFHLDEFLLRVDRLLTRAEWSQSSYSENQSENEAELKEFIFGENKIDFLNLKAQCREGLIELTLQEIKLLKYFVENANITLPREKILKEALGYDPDTSTRTLDNFIVRFRKYFEDDPKNPIYFISVRSVGYIFDIKDEVH